MNQIFIYCEREKIDIHVIMQVIFRELAEISAEKKVKESAYLILFAVLPHFQFLIYSDFHK